MTSDYNWLMIHPWILATITTGLYHIGSAFVGALEMPDTTSSKWYRFFFRFTNTLAANYARASAEKQIVESAAKKE